MTTFHVIGKIISSWTKQGIGDLVVEAWDKDLIINDLLGKAVSDNQGDFKIDFSESSFRDLIFFDRKPDLFFKIYRGDELIATTKNSVLWNVSSRDKKEINIEINMDMQESQHQLEKERSLFKLNLLENPNYFGNLTESSYQTVVEMAGNVKYEELTCIGFNPEKNLLEAAISVKLPFGYGGNLCQAGTTEYVRFFVDYGAGWEDAGLTGVRVHDIPTKIDCAEELNKPLSYVASLQLSPKTQCCTHPVLPKVRAILSWEWIPPVGPANADWSPPWGNVMECHIQIKPHPWNIICMLEEIGKDFEKQITIPKPFEAIKYDPIPLPDPAPLTLAELAKKYSVQPVEVSAQEKCEAEAFSVEPHRFGTKEVHAILSMPGFNQDMVSAKVAVWESIGLDWAAALAALANTKANVTYEEIECLGLDENYPERLIANFRIKRPSGYSGDLCKDGSTEYVAFWSDWDNECKWTYMGTAQVNVHDIKSIPAEGLCYSAILPVDLDFHRRSCNKPKIARVRAVLSWSVPPSTTNPDALNYWGNRLDRHVQINPGDAVDPNKPIAKIRNLGGIAIEDIDTAGVTGAFGGMTKTVATGGGSVYFAHYHWAPADAWGLNRPCPFGGNVVVEGLFYLGYYYRVRAQKQGDPSTLITLDTDFLVERSDLGYDHQVSAGGWFKYLDPVQEFDRTLAVWPSSGDGLWEVQLEIATAPNDTSIIAWSNWYHIRLDNTAPTIPSDLDIHIDAGGDCKDFAQGGTITGTFIADHLHFGAWSLSTEPNTTKTPSNQPEAKGIKPPLPLPVPLLAITDPAPSPAGHPWTLYTSPPPAGYVTMKPCGYVVRLEVWDRTIVHSVPYSHNWNHIEVGFCLREK